MQASKLKWQCRRGLKELDVLLERFLAETYAGLDGRQQAAFRRLLQLEDPDLHACLIGQQAVSDTEMNDVIERIRGRA